MAYLALEESIIVVHNLHPSNFQVIDPDGTIRELTSGDAFGVRLPPPGSPPSTATAVQKHRGQMRTVTEDCQFVCVAQADYFRVMARAADAEVPETEEGDSGRVVLVYEDIQKETGQAADGGLTSTSPSLPSTQVSRVVIKVRHSSICIQI